MTSELGLHPLEKKLLISLSEANGAVEFSKASEDSGLSPDQLRRAIEWLRSKNLISLKEDSINFYALGNEGLRLAREGFPERRLVSLLKSKGGSGTFAEIFMAFGNESSIALGKAKENGWVKTENRNISLSSTEIPESQEELLVSKLSSLGSVQESMLSHTEKETLSSLLKRYRGLVVGKQEKRQSFELTEAGKKASSSSSTMEEELDALTPQVLSSGEWKGKSLRAIDVTSPAPNIFPGRRHPIRMFMQEVRESFISLGFEEISGPIAQSALWNFDALFIPQQHSTREMQDTFYIGGGALLKANISGFKKEIESIKASHEKGEGTGSLGWRYPWSEKEAQRVVLRTHTTAITIRYLSEKRPEEARVFSIGRVYRNEKANYKHNPEFYQIEGVTVGPNLNVRNLISIISKFYSKLGFDNIKFWPTYFPYTEPSLQTMVYVQKMQKWMELGGMGVFRPEVTIPLGVKNPVLAWGLGLDRLVMLRYDLKDIRELFGANLGLLRVLGE